MAVSASYKAFVLEQVARVAPAIRAKAMFGGVGIYSDDIFFALIDDDVLYLKVDDTNRGEFESRGLEPFRPFGPEGETMQYYPLPEELLEDAEALEPWVATAIAVARRKKTKRRAPRA